MMGFSSILKSIIARLAFTLFKVPQVEFYVIKPYEELEKLKEELHQRRKTEEKKIAGYYADKNRSQ